MSLVDRWLTRQTGGIATAATTATLLKTPRTVTGLDVATGLRHPATSEPAFAESMNLSQPVAIGLRQEKAQDAAVSEGVSLLSQLSQEAFPIWSGAEEERAAIVEHGAIPRAWAEGFASLDPDRPPADVPLRRWQGFVDDVGLFLDSPFRAVAATRGWGPLDLFGCDREQPFRRIDHAGLLWLLNGDRIVELNRHAAIIERRTGAQQRYHRRPVAVGEVVLAWELVAVRPNV